MSRYYASIRGQAETEATRRGGVKDGIQSHMRGRNLGVEVCSYPSVKGSDLDSFNIYVTSGSRKAGSRTLFASIHERAGGAEPQIELH